MNFSSRIEVLDVKNTVREIDSSNPGGPKKVWENQEKVRNVLRVSVNIGDGGIGPLLVGWQVVCFRVPVVLSRELDLVIRICSNWSTWTKDFCHKEAFLGEDIWTSEAVTKGGGEEDLLEVLGNEVTTAVQKGGTGGAPDFGIIILWRIFGL